MDQNLQLQTIEEEILQKMFKQMKFWPENAYLFQVDLELEFGYGIIPLADVKPGRGFTRSTVMIRGDCVRTRNTVYYSIAR